MPTKVTDALRIWAPREPLSMWSHFPRPRTACFYTALPDLTLWTRTGGPDTLQGSWSRARTRAPLYHSQSATGSSGTIANR